MCLLFCLLLHVVSNTAFYKEQPVLEFLKEVINNDGGRGGGGRGRGRGGGGGRRDYSDEDSVRQLPSYLTDAQRRQFAKDIKG